MFNIIVNFVKKIQNFYNKLSPTMKIVVGAICAYLFYTNFMIEYYDEYTDEENKNSGFKQEPSTPVVVEEPPEPDSVFTKAAGLFGVKTPQALKKYRRSKAEADNYAKYVEKNPGVSGSALFKIAKADDFMLYE